MGRIQGGNDLPHTQPANFPPETEPENYPYESDQTGPENYPPKTQPENYPYDQSEKGPDNYPPKTQPENYPYDQSEKGPESYPPKTQPENYPYDQSEKGPENYPPQSNTQAPPTSENSNQTAAPHQLPVKFPPPQPNVNGHPPQATSQVYPHAPPAPYKSVPQQNTATPVLPVQQTYPPAAMQAAPMDWSTGLFDCLQDPVHAVITCFFPCYTFGQIAEIIDNGDTSCGTSGLTYFGIEFLTGCPWLYSCTYRTKLRSKFGLTESPAPDWLIHCFCEHCALDQEYRELESRGFDPSLGWIGNMSKNQNMQREVAMAAPVIQTTME